MRKALARHQTIKYHPYEPFHVQNASIAGANEFYVKNSHWHEELEICYILRGHSIHYIDGECIDAEPGRLVVVNCESLHRVELDSTKGSEAIVLLIQSRFLAESFPEYKNFCFTNERKQARTEVRDIILQFSDYVKKIEHAPNEHIYMRGLLLQLLYYMLLDGSAERSDTAGRKRQEHVQMVKEVLQYVESHYRDPIKQADIAKNFYFTPQYFSRYFKQATGITFTEHLTRYRVNQARLELLNTSRRISDIARDNGFNDDRSFINAFKKQYHVTPLQYRKSQATDAAEAQKIK